MKSFFSICLAFLICPALFGVIVTIETGTIKAPNYDGTFKEESIGNAARVFLCLTDAFIYETYSNDSQGLYEAWEAGSFNSVKDKATGETATTGEFQTTFFSDASPTLYAIAIATYYSEEYRRTYYVARVLSEVFSGDDPDFDPVDFLQTISDAVSWSYIDDEPPSITCTDLCVTGGVVSATYSISEFSRLNEIVSGEETSVIVAADLARTTQTNLAANVTATNSGESTFTFSFNPAEQNWTNSTLFIFGVEPPR